MCMYWEECLQEHMCILLQRPSLVVVAVQTDGLRASHAVTDVNDMDKYGRRVYFAVAAVLNVHQGTGQGLEGILVTPPAKVHNSG